MARSSISSLKGMLTHADKAFGSRGRSGGSDGGCAGCSGCLVVVVIMFGIYVIVEYWIPILIAIGVVAALVVLRGLVARKKAKRPALPVAPSDLHSATADAKQCPAGWYADPAGQHQHRYWDGGGWSDAVADNGVVSTHWPWAPRSE